MSAIIVPRYSKIDFENVIYDQNTLNLIYNFYISIINNQLWNEISKENKYKILNNLCNDPVLINDNHSGLSINFCFNHILYLKENGYNNYANYLKNN